MCSNQNKIKKLSKIVSNRFELVFTAFFLLSVACSFDAVAMEFVTAPQGAGDEINLYGEGAKSFKRKIDEVASDSEEIASDSEAIKGTPQNKRPNLNNSSVRNSSTGRGSGSVRNSGAGRGRGRGPGMSHTVPVVFSAAKSYPSEEQPNEGSSVHSLFDTNHPTSPKIPGDLSLVIESDENSLALIIPGANHHTPPKTLDDLSLERSAKKKVKTPVFEFDEAYVQGRAESPKKIDTSKFFSNPLHGNKNEGKDDEDLYAQVDIAPADAEMEKIIDCLAFFQGDYEEALRKKYSDVKGELKDYLMTGAWKAATGGGDLSQIVGKLSRQVEGLQGKCRELEERAEEEGCRLVAEQENQFLETCARSLCKPSSISTLEELQGEILNLSGEASKLRTENAELLRESLKTEKEKGKLALECLELLKQVSALKDQSE